MKIKNIIKTMAVCAVAGTLTGCDDFLTIKPLNEIVLEDYWAEENDVTSSLNSCYSALAAGDCVQRMVVWGELRSDNMIEGTGASNDIRMVCRENILETNGFTTWGAFYDVINQCNTLIHYAPSVAEIDPNYTQSELKTTIAEATTLRSLAYFYLIRAFRDVPYTTEPSLTDEQVYQIPATKFDDVLDSLIVSMEAVKDDAMKVFGQKNKTTLVRPREDTGRVTRLACYALLADLYLWKGDYQKCIEYCDKVIDQKIADYKEDFLDSPANIKAELYGRYPLISERIGSAGDGGSMYNQIFGEGNSFESIFELTYEQNEGASNGTVGNFYGTTSNNGSIAAPTYLCTDVYKGLNNYFKKTDYRALEFMEDASTDCLIKKYVYGKVSFPITPQISSTPKLTVQYRSSNYANWIIYRLTDVILMRSEAEVELAGNVEAGDQLTEEQESHYRAAFDGVSAVWKRANNRRVATSSDTLKYADYATSRLAMEDLVYDERQRELMFEGKRWFDLVRLARREGSTKRLVDKVMLKVESDMSKIKIKLASLDAIFMPYNRAEMKQNPLLIQNAAYETDNFEKTN